MERAVRIGRRLVKIGLGVVGLFLFYLFLVAVVPGIAAPAQPLERTAPTPGPAGDAAARDRTSVSFEVDGTPVSAWLYLPDDLSAPVPAVVMANGAGGLKEMILPDYAVRFRAAGFAVLAFDYRYWGESGGEPRQLIWIPDQVADLAVAIDYARGRAEIDPSRIALWGTSFGGGHVVTTAAEDHEIGAVIAQVPFLDGVAAYELEREGDTIGLSLLTLMHGQRDIARSWLGLSPNAIPIVGKPGTIAMMAGQEAWDFFAAHAPEDFVNEVPARIMIRADKYRPIKSAGDVQCPVLLQMAERDPFVPAGAIEETARALGDRATLQRYDIGHFEIYTGDAFEKSVADQLAFLDEYLR
jgi:uncharacterized protein